MADNTTIWDVARSVYPEWRSMAGRVQITQEQIEDSMNNQGAFLRAHTVEMERIAREWHLNMEYGIRNGWPPFRWAGDPDLELDEGL